MKSKGTAILLCFFLGGFGAHKFYLGQTGAGVVYLLFCWTFIPAIIAFIEMIILICMSEQDFNAKYNSWRQPQAVYAQQPQTVINVQTPYNDRPTASPDPVYVPSTADAVRSSDTCSRCGEVLKPGAKFCTKCGAPAASLQTRSNLMCAGCGAELIDGAKFCAKCGTPVGASSSHAVHHHDHVDHDGPHEHHPHYRCPKCHHDVEADTTVCPGCGAHLKPHKSPDAHHKAVHYCCPKCHHELEAGATQCPGCGVRLRPRTSQN